MALYRKYRPLTFTDVVGQHQVSDTLMRAVREDKVAHAYLFAGPRGTGKTSMAKILARAVNCEHGPTDHPCNECEICRSILSGQSMDVLEIDAASNRGIDEIRALRESVKFMPAMGRKKVFIIDEAHMLTTEAWNALLKTIEEPPAHVMFIFATTEIEKLPVTIISRCQRYTFRRITSDDIAGRLLYVAQKEGFLLSDGAARLIAVHADGGLRDALSILDQCAGMAVGEITTGVVEELIGLVSKQWIIQFFDALRSGDGAKVLEYVESALNDGRDAVQIMEALILHIRALLVGKVAPHAEELKVYDAFRDDFEQQVQSVDFGELNLYIRNVQTVMNDAKKVDNPRTIIEMGLLVLCARLSQSEAGLEERVVQLEQSQHSESEDLFNRLARLEAGGAVSAPPISGGNPYLQNRSDVEWTPISTPDTSTVGIPAQGVTDSMQTGTVPPPQRGAVPPPIQSGGVSSSTQKGVVPPPSLQQETLPPKQEVKRDQKITGVSTSFQIGEDIVPVAEYKTIQGHVIKYLKDSKKGMSSTILSQGQLVYADRNKAVIAFKNKLHLSLVANSANKTEIEDAFQYALGYRIYVEVVDALTPLYQEYKKAADGAPSKAVHRSGRPAAQPDAVASSDSVISPDDVLRQTPEEAKAAALAALQKKGASVNVLDSDASGSDVSTCEAIPSPIPEEIPDEDDIPVMSLDGTTVMDTAPPSVKEVKVEREYEWNPDVMTEEEKRNPLLAETLEQLSEDHDIYVEVISDDGE